MTTFYVRTNTENARDAPSHLHIVSHSWGGRRCSHLYTTSCQAGGCTWGDTCISGRSPCPRSCAGSLRCHGCKSLRVTCSHKHRNKDQRSLGGIELRVCWGWSADKHVQVQPLWFLASSNPGRHSQATPTLGVSLQMWAQPCSLFIQLRPSGTQREGERCTQ